MTDSIMESLIYVFALIMYMGLIITPFYLIGAFIYAFYKDFIEGDRSRKSDSLPTGEKPG